MNTYKKEQIDEIVEIIRNGGVVAFATETVYGLGVIFNNKDSFDKLVETKRRSPDKPFSMMLSDVDDLEKYCDLDDNSRKIVSKFMPGEITILVNAKNVDSWVTLGTGVVGIRIPNEDFVRLLIRKVGKPMLVTSANRSGEPAYTKFNDVCKDFVDIDAIVEGNCVSNLPSTIINFTTPTIKIVRVGSVSEEEIFKALKE